MPRQASLLLLLLLPLLGALAVPAAAEGPCELQLSGGTEAFDHCFLGTDVGNNFHIMWKLLPGGLVRWGMNASSDGKSYVALGYPGEEDEDNAMIGGTAFSLHSCADCLTGAQLRQILMKGTTSGDMHASDQLPMTDVVAQEAGGWLMGAFTTTQPPPSDEPEILYAAGMVYRTGDIRMHSEFGVSVVNLQTGGVGEPEYFDKPVSALLSAHIWLTLIGWGFLIPIGIVMARCFKNLDPLWFKVHRACQLLGLMLGLVGFGIGFAVANGWDGAFPSHRNLGIAATVLGLLQLSALFRPALESPRRRKWNVAHWWLGRAAAVCAVANILYGLARMVDTGSWGWGSYTAVIGTIVAVGILKESYDYVLLPPPGSPFKPAKQGPALMAAESAMTSKNVSTVELGAVPLGN